MIQDKPVRVVYFHESAGRVSAENTVHLDSCALIDFVTTALDSKSVSATLLLPEARSPGQVELQVPRDIRVKTMALPLLSRNPLDMVKAVTQIPSWIRSGFRAASIFRDSDVLIMTSYSTATTTAAVLWRLINRGPLVFIVRGDRYQTVRASKRPLVRKTLLLARILLYRSYMRSLLARGAAHAWFQGKQNLLDTRRALGACGEDHTHLLNAVLDDSLIPSATEPAGGGTRFDLMFAGRLVIEKGLVDLIKALETLHEKGLQPKIGIMGTGPDEARLRSLANAGPCAGQIEFLGMTADRRKVIQAISEARALVLPSHAEGLPRVAVEAMSVYVPTILTAVGGIPFAFEDEIDCLMIPPKSPAALAGAIEKFLLADPKQIATMTENAHEKAMAMSFSQRREWVLSEIERLQESAVTSAG